VTGSGGLGFAEIDDLDRTGDPGRSLRLLQVVGCLEAVLDEQVQVVPLVEDLAVDVRVVFGQQPDLSVLLGDELLIHRGDLDEQILVRQVEVGSEVGRRLAVVGELDRKRPRFVVPAQPVEIEESRELALALVGKRDVVGWCREVDGQGLRLHPGACQFDHVAIVAVLGVETVDFPFELGLHRADGDSELALASAEHVHDLIGTVGGEDRRAGGTGNPL